MRKTYLFLASLMVSLVSLADWQKPAAPAAQPLSAGTECYLYNLDAEGYLVGANDWGTRASYDATLGHKVILEAGTVDGSYFITNYVLQGGMANQWGYMFLDGIDAIYVDNTKDGKKNNQYTFLPQANNIYNIGLSSANETFKDEEGYLLAGMPEKNDTRLYFCDPVLSAGACQINWIIVSPADYEAHITAVKQYNAAMVLEGALKEANANGVGSVYLVDAQEVYDNHKSTAEQLLAAAEKLNEVTKAVIFDAASVANPVELLKWFDIASDFSNGPTGWTSTTGAQNKGADNGNNAKDFATTGNHYENWNPNPFTPGKISATLKDIPAGIYRLNALAFSNSGRDAYLFAGAGRTAVTATQIDVDQEFATYTVLAGSELEFGLDIPVQGPNWVGLDNVQLYYLGADAESMKHFVEKVLEAQPRYDEMIEAGTKAQNSVIAAYNAAREALMGAENIEKLADAYKAFMDAAATLEESIAAYDAYRTLTDEAMGWMDDATGESDEILLLGAYLNDTDSPAAGQYNGNGTGAYILENCLLDAAQIAAEQKYLEQIYRDAKANNMKDGDDVTSLLVNPNFKEQGGWTSSNPNVKWPTGNPDFPVIDTWGLYFDVYQELTGLQNGLYEMNLQAVYSTEEETRQTYAYINDFDTKIGCATVEDPVGTSDQASEAFKAGKYPVKVYGLVTDGTMRLGVANRLRTNESAGVYAGGVTLTFRAKNAEALASMLADLTPKAQALTEAKCGMTEQDAIKSALEEANSSDDKYSALLSLKAAIDAANEGVSIYQELEVALFNLDQAILNAGESADKATLSLAQSYFKEINEKYDGQSLSNEEAIEATEQLKAYTVAIKMGNSIASEENPVDYSSAIVNNTFDPSMGSKDEKRIDGWSVSGALNGYKQNTCSFNKGTFDLHQDLAGLPAGLYEVTVHTYYRAGSYEEEEANILAGNDTHLMKLYANDQETNVMNLSEGSKDVTLPEGIGTRQINGITVPDGTGASAACYAAGLFLNKLRFTVGEDGKATIGLKLDKTIGSNDYTVVGEWNLWYMGNASADVTEQDVTDLIVNNTFDPSMGSKDEKRIDGWSVIGALNGYKQNTCSFNKGTFDLHQDLSGLPKGLYKVTVQTYYRAGSYEEEEANILAGNDTHLMKLYANDQETSVMNLSEGSKGVTLPEGIGTREICGITVPDGTSASAACYAAGLFLNELEFTVAEDGKATIGLKLDKTIGTNDYTVVGPWHLYYYGDKVKEDEGLKDEQIVSDLIINNNFDPANGNKDEKRIDGWSVSGALNGYKSYSCSFNKGTFDLHQKLSGLPEGTYKVTVHTFYRAGSYEEEEANILAGNDTHLMKLYANAEQNYETSVMNLSEGSKDATLPEGIVTRQICGITVPDGTGASVACFNEGLFLNELPFYVGKNGEVTIGLKLDQTIGTNDYTVIGKWDLYYYGSGNNVEQLGDVTAIETIKPEAEAIPVAIYNVNGVRLSQPQPGINIIKMSNGRTIKMMMK